MRRIDFFLVPFAMDASVAMGGLLSNLRAQDLGAAPFQIGLIGFSWGLPYALACPFAGKASGRYDRRWILVVGLLLYAVAVAGYGLAAAPVHLMLSAPLGGLGCALFWPAFETLLHTDSADETRLRLGIFNVGWTLGILTGSASGGFYYQRVGAAPALFSIAALTAATAGYLAWRTRGGIEDLPASDAAEGNRVPSLLPVARRAGYLKMAWVANFALWFSGAAVNTIFPKLARSLSIGDGPIGLLMAAIMLAQATSFALLSRTARWHYRLAPLVAMQALAAGGLLLLALGASPLVLGAGMLMVGFGRGLSYSASLLYGLDSAAARGLNAGIHEAIIGAAFVTSPLVSGLTAEKVSLSAPFAVATLVVAAGILVQVALWRRLPPCRPQAPLRGLSPEAGERETIV